jgi:predicted ribosomally synthesized peptide with SipW-like signal peptide
MVVVAAYVVAGSLTGTYALFSDSERVPASIAAAPDFGPGPGSIAATVDIDPDTLNPGSQGNFVTAYIELAQGYNVAAVEVSTVTLGVEGIDNGVPAESNPTEIGDHDGDTISDLMVKFDRAAVVALLGGVGEYVTFVVAGELSSGERFEGSDVVRLLDLPTVTPTPVQTATPELMGSVTPTSSLSAVPTLSPTPSATPAPAPGGVYVSVTCQGQPVVGAQVSIIGLHPQTTLAWSGATGEDGAFGTGFVLGPGSYMVDIRVSGANYDTLFAAVPAGDYAQIYAQCTAVSGPEYQNW